MPRPVHPRSPGSSIRTQTASTLPVSCCHIQVCGGSTQWRTCLEWRCNVCSRLCWMGASRVARCSTGVRSVQGACKANHRGISEPQSAWQYKRRRAQSHGMAPCGQGTRLSTMLQKASRPIRPLRLQHAQNASQLPDHPAMIPPVFFLSLRRKAVSSLATWRSVRNSR